MKIVQINSVCGFGSTGKIAAGLSDMLSGRGIENCVFYGIGESRHENGVKFGSGLNMRSHQIKTRLFGKHGFYSKRASRELVERLSEIEPDLVHLHNLHGHYLNVEILFEYLKASRVPVVWTLHDCWSFTGHCAHFDYIGCEKWKTVCGSCPQLREYPKSLIFDRSKESFIDKKRLFTGLSNLTLAAPSNWLARKVSESFLSGYPLRVIENGVDTETFNIRESDFKKRHGIEDKFMILGVSSFWNERKGYGIFKEISRMLKSDEVLVLVGVSEIQKRELPESVIGISRTSSASELAEIYSASDVFANPTLEEVFGLVNIESLSCGTPVVTFDTGGSPETVDEKTGLVVPRGDSEKLVSALRKVKIEAPFSKADCRERAAGKFDIAEKNEMYYRLYMQSVKSEI